MEAVGEAARPLAGGAVVWRRLELREEELEAAHPVAEEEHHRRELHEADKVGRDRVDRLRHARQQLLEAREVAEQARDPQQAEQLHEAHDLEELRQQRVVRARARRRGGGRVVDGAELRREDDEPVKGEGGDEVDKQPRARVVLQDERMARHEVAVVLVGSDHVQHHVDHEEDVYEEVEGVDGLGAAGGEREAEGEVDGDPRDQDARQHVPPRA